MSDLLDSENKDLLKTADTVQDLVDTGVAQDLTEGPPLTSPTADETRENLLDTATNTQDLVDKAQIVTEVTSVAKENAKGGDIKVPTSEEIVQRATISYYRNITMLADLVKSRSGKDYRISRKGMNRVLSSILQMPTDGLPVALQGDEEKVAFHLGQKILMDRYIIIHHHIVEEQKRLKEEQLLKEQSGQVVTETTQPTTNNTEETKNV